MPDSREPGEDAEYNQDALAALARHGRQRDALLAHIVRLLAADTRVAAAWLSGSFGRGEEDEWSDLDLHVAVYDAHVAAFLEERPALFARAGDPILVQADMPSDSLPGGRFALVQYAGAHEVDWNIGPAGKAARPAASVVLFDRLGVPIATPLPLTSAERRAQAEHWLIFFWAMAPIAMKLAGRAESRRAAAQIDLLARALISLWRLLDQPGGPNPHLPASNRPLEAELDARLPRLGVIIDPPATLAVISALCAEVAALHPALATLGVPIPPTAAGETAALGKLAAAVLRAGGRQTRRTYR